MTIERMRICVLINYGYRHTLRICNIYSFYTAAMVVSNAPHCYVFTSPVFFRYLVCAYQTRIRSTVYLTAYGLSCWFVIVALTTFLENTVVVS